MFKRFILITWVILAMMCFPNWAYASSSMAADHSFWVSVASKATFGILTTAPVVVFMALQNRKK